MQMRSARPESVNHRPPSRRALAGREAVPGRRCTCTPLLILAGRPTSTAFLKHSSTSPSSSSAPRRVSLICRRPALFQEYLCLVSAVPQRRRRQRCRICLCPGRTYCAVQPPLLPACCSTLYQIASMISVQVPQFFNHPLPSYSPMSQPQFFNGMQAYSKPSPMGSYMSPIDKQKSHQNGKRRPSRAGTRSVATLTAAQLERKRANDREYVLLLLLHCIIF
jgi:hypothetical protein